MAKAFVQVRLWVELRDLFDDDNIEGQAIALLDRIEGKPIDDGGMVLHQIGFIEVVAADDATTLDEALIAEAVQPLTGGIDLGRISGLLKRRRMAL